MTDRPTHNVFRIAGALGISPNPTEDGGQEEVILQGIGFPLRPISGVPSPETPPLGNDLIAEGVPTQWMGNWQGGKYYPAGAFVRDGTVTAICVVGLTLEKPEPIPDPGDPESTGLPDPWVGASTESNTSVVVSGQTYTFSQSGWIKELKIYATELTGNTNYRIIIANVTDPESIVTSIIDDPLLTEDAWRVVSFLNSLILPGTKLSISIDALNSGADTNISGGWQYNGPTQPPAAPPVSNWTQDNQRTSFRIDKTDLDLTDRGTELEGVIPETLISVVETANVGNTVTYRVTSVTDSGAFMTYGVVLQDETGDIGVGTVCTLDIDIPIALPTEYAEETLVWGTPPSWASTVEGFLLFDGVDQVVPTTNAYGVDILFEPAEISTDWDIVSIE